MSFFNLLDLSNISVLHRAGFAFLTSLFLVLILGNPYIKFVKLSKNFLQPIRDVLPEHQQKQGTPTMGGLLFMVVFWLSSFLWIVNLNNIVIIILLVSLGFTLLGFIDDALKLAFKNHKGLPGKFRLFVGSVISLAAVYYLLQEYPPEIAKSIFFPFIHSFYMYVGVGILFFGAFVIVGTANSVNLTDGLDGLASVVISTILLTFMVLIVLIITPGVYTNFLYSAIFYFNDIHEILIICAALMGAILGFLWFNSFPAKIFMGDVGSLGIGGTLGIIAVSLKQELFLAVAGLFLVIESLSVIIQVYVFRLTRSEAKYGKDKNGNVQGKRIFLKTPIHHHFQLKGVAETAVVSRVWIFTIIMCVLALLLLDI
ncbi:MAG: phospho-N-acetylmuramoyl-pentapeptide-transferase [Alphaproteobacteria bacterium]|jgi:phospho-N-acetylmuramoyl-pentapeptide-transferase|nr:phospho-N-acetylmuramoyl-pentapeptide-transferase [Alphaproteobacteria bacterium]